MLRRLPGLPDTLCFQGRLREGRFTSLTSLGMLPESFWERVADTDKPQCKQVLLALEKLPKYSWLQVGRYAKGIFQSTRVDPHNWRKQLSRIFIPALKVEAGRHEELHLRLIDDGLSNTIALFVSPPIPALYAQGERGCTIVTRWMRDETRV